MKLKRILLLNPPGDKRYLRDNYCSSVSRANYYWPPIDLLVLSGTLGKKYQVELLDAIIANIGKEKCHERITTGDFDAIIFLSGTSSWVNCDAYSRMIQANRLKEAKNTGADVLITACPKCQIHFSCTQNAEGYPDEDKIKIIDSTTLFADALA